MKLLNPFRARRPAVVAAEPDGPWAILNSLFFEGTPAAPVALVGTPYCAGTRTGGDGQLYAEVCIGTAPDAIDSIQTKSRQYCAEMAQAWMDACDALNPAPAALADGQPVPFLTARGQA